MRIGPYELARPWILAPMAGVSEMPFRLIALEMGAGAAVTELVSAKGLIYGQPKTLEYLKHSPVERPFWVQVFGSDPDVVAEGAQRAVEAGAHIIDINMGCPVHKVIKTGAGAALMRDPDLAACVVRAVSRRTCVPVTAKIRSGWDTRSINAVEVAKALAGAGCSAIAVHPRTRSQGYAGRADWSVIAAVVQAVHIPVIGNGDVREPEDGPSMLAQTGCHGVMVGRGVLGRPWLFRGLCGDARVPNSAERWEIAKRHLLALVEFVGDEKRGLRRFRPHLGWYSQGLPGCARFRRSVLQVDDLAEVLERCERFFSGSVKPS